MYNCCSLIGELCRAQPHAHRVLHCTERVAFHRFAQADEPHADGDADQADDVLDDCECHVEVTVRERIAVEGEEDEDEEEDAHGAVQALPLDALDGLFDDDARRAEKLAGALVGDFHVFERFDRFRRSALVQFEEGVDGQMIGIVEPGGVIRDFV